jgi:hypothetical protein
MALKIKKQYKNADGTITEVEGTEAEVESFEKKNNKKNESAQKKKEILHGKKAKNVDMEELKRFLIEEVQKLAAIREVHHWYYNNGWWWRPWWFNGAWTYIYSQTQPVAGYNGDTRLYSTTTNAADLSKCVGVSATDVVAKSVINSSSGIYSQNISSWQPLKYGNNVTLTAATNNGSYTYSTADGIKSSETDVTSVMNSYGMSVN